MQKRKMFLFCSFLMLQIFVYGQRKITGTVVSANDNSPIVGAIVKVKSLTGGTVTNLDGKYQIDVPEGYDTLVFSAFEMEAQEIVINANLVINVFMKSPTEMEEVVITALGIKRSEKALGYAVSTVDGDDIRNSNQTNLVNSLNGVVAGANVTQASGTAGGSSSVVLRGFTSLTGDNQALFVIDGVKINNSETSLGGEATDNTESVSFSNRGIDLNPDDIESITVLKGGAASAMYGIDGANGVIIITTKKGKASKDGKVSVTAGSSVTASQVNRLPELQNKYGQGSAWYSADGMTPEYLGPETGWLTSWGPAVSELSYDGATDNPYDKNGNIVLNSDPSAKTAVSPYTNLDDFFKTGLSFKNNFAITGGNDVANLRFSVSNVKESGVVPMNTFEKTNISLGSNLSFFDKKLNVSGTANYINSGGYRIQQGSNLSGVMLGLLRTPVTFDNSNGYDKPWENEASYTMPDGTQRNYRGGGGYDNPFWSVVKNPFNDDVNRLIGNAQASYEFSKWLVLGTNLGLDTYSDKRKQVFAIGSRANPAGKVTEEMITVKQTDLYLTLSGTGKFKKYKKFDIAYQSGLNSFSFESNQLYSIGNGFAFDNFGNLGAATTVNSAKEVNGYKSFSMFGNVDLGYNSLVYLTLTGRQDFDSRFIVPGSDYKMSDIGFFYPSVSTSFIFSELLPNVKKMDFGKLRVSWAQVSKGPTDSYATSTAYEQYSGAQSVNDSWTSTGNSFPFNGVTALGLSNVQGSPSLVPETSNEFELGTNISFFKRRIDLDVAVYNRKTKDAILPAAVSGATGFSYILMNSGEMHTNGIDLSLSTTILRKKDYSWSIGTTFSKYKSVVDKLADGLDQLFVGGFSDAGIYHIPGQEYGQIYGGDYARTEDGTLIIDNDTSSLNYGYPIADPEMKVIGNPNPKFILGITNSLSIKRFQVSFLVDMKVGGQMWNGTAGALTFFGMSKNTEDRDQPGETSHVFEGVTGHYDEDGNMVYGEGQNEVEVGLNEDWYTGNGGGFGNVASPFVQNASTYRLRNFTVSYTLPLKKVKISSMSEIRFYLTGNNLLLFTPYTGVDPETSLVGSSSNGKGIDYFNMPNTRSITFGINFKL
jgi:TonB-linked SusC/RagA family outer membrane protein